MSTEFSSKVVSGDFTASFVYVINKIPDEHTNLSFEHKLN